MSEHKMEINKKGVAIGAGRISVERTHMSIVRTVWGTVWRSVVVGIGYILALIVTGVISSALGVQLPDTQGGESLLAWLFVSGILIGLFLGPLASQMLASRLQHIAVWGSVIFFNLGSVMIEGALFAP